MTQCCEKYRTLSAEADFSADTKAQRPLLGHLRIAPQVDSLDDRTYCGFTEATDIADVTVYRLTDWLEVRAYLSVPLNGRCPYFLSLSTSEE